MVENEKVILVMLPHLVLVLLLSQDREPWQWYLLFSTRRMMLVVETDPTIVPTALAMVHNERLEPSI